MDLAAAQSSVSLWWLIPVLALALAAIVLRTVFGLRAYRSEKAGKKPSLTRGLVIAVWAWLVIMIAFTIFVGIFEHLNRASTPRVDPVWIVAGCDVAFFVLALVLTLQWRRRRVER